MVSMGNSNMQVLTVRQQVASAIQLLVQTARLSDGARRVVAISEVTGMEEDVITLDDIFVFQKRGIDPEGRVVGQFAATGIRPKFDDKLVTAGIHLRPEILDETMEV
jgi:pilus assembly protein CpaF